MIGKGEKNYIVSIFSSVDLSITKIKYSLKLKSETLKDIYV